MDEHSFVVPANNGLRSSTKRSMHPSPAYSPGLLPQVLEGSIKRGKQRQSSSSSSAGVVAHGSSDGVVLLRQRFDVRDGEASASSLHAPGEAPVNADKPSERFMSRVSRDKSFFTVSYMKGGAEGDINDGVEAGGAGAGASAAATGIMSRGGGDEAAEADMNSSYNENDEDAGQKDAAGEAASSGRGLPSTSAAAAAALAAAAVASKATRHVSLSANAGLKAFGGRGALQWSPAEDAQLVAAIESLGMEDWTRIAQLVRGRTAQQCMSRWVKALKIGKEKGPWTEEENAVIINAVNNCPEGAEGVRWADVAAMLPGRLGKQCRERWQNCLDPKIRRGPFEAAEDRAIFEAQSLVGNKWSAIAALIPGRNENMVKNRWNSGARRKWAVDMGLPLEDRDALALLHHAKIDASRLREPGILQLASLNASPALPFMGGYKYEIGKGWVGEVPPPSLHELGIVEIDAPGDSGSALIARVQSSKKRSGRSAPTESSSATKQRGAGGGSRQLKSSLDDDEVADDEVIEEEGFFENEESEMELAEAADFQIDAAAGRNRTPSVASSRARTSSLTSTTSPPIRNPRSSKATAAADSEAPHSPSADVRQLTGSVQALGINSAKKPSGSGKKSASRRAAAASAGAESSEIPDDSLLPKLRGRATHPGSSATRSRAPRISPFRMPSDGASAVDAISSTWLAPALDPPSNAALSIAVTSASAPPLLSGLMSMSPAGIFSEQMQAQLAGLVPERGASATSSDGGDFSPPQNGASKSSTPAEHARVSSSASKISRASVPFSGGSASFSSNFFTVPPLSGSGNHPYLNSLGSHGSFEPKSDASTTPNLDPTRESVGGVAGGHQSSSSFYGRMDTDDALPVGLSSTRPKNSLMSPGGSFGSSEFESSMSARMNGEGMRGISGSLSMSSGHGALRGLSSSGDLPLPLSSPSADLFSPPVLNVDDALPHGLVSGMLSVDAHMAGLSSLGGLLVGGSSIMRDPKRQM